MAETKVPIDTCVGIEAELRGLRVESVKGSDQVWTVGQIRNACRDGYSYDRETVLTRESQLSWWAAQRGQAKAWLFYDGLGLQDRLVGFGMLRPIDGGRITTVVGVLPEARGHDYGLSITRYLVHAAWAQIWATGAIDNPAAVRLHDPGHWREVEAPDEHVRAFEAIRFDDEVP